VKTEMQREYEQLCRIDENPGVQGLAQLGRNAINRVSRLESQLASADARTAELERNIERLDAQWREELRIYRESGDARIAELESEVARLRDALDLSALEYADLAVSAKSLEAHLSALVEVSEDSTIARARAVLNGDDIGEDEDEDAARANGGEW